MRRLFSTFARGWPGAGLLIMRVVAASAVFAEAWPSLTGTAAQGETILALLTSAGAVLLLIGLWTPVVGSVVASVAIWRAATATGDPWARILLATLAAAVALVGPGAWSIDALLFGWKRIDVRNRPGPRH